MRSILGQGLGTPVKDCGRLPTSFETVLCAFHRVMHFSARQSKPSRKEPCMCWLCRAETSGYATIMSFNETRI